MFDPERLLGQMMGDALSGRLGGKRRKHSSSGVGSLLGGLSTGTKAKVGLGLLGLAVAAYQHYQDQQTRPAQASAGSVPPPPPGPAEPPPPPGAPVAGTRTEPTMPPPPPGAPPMPLPATGIASGDEVAALTGLPFAAPTPARSEHAMLLLRAMITAADADGLIDAAERDAILGRARAAGFDDDSLQQLDMEIRAPLTVAQLAVRTPPDLREEVYAAALIAIRADTDAERAFLADLAARIGLDAAARAALHSQLGLDPPGA